MTETRKVARVNTRTRTQNAHDFVHKMRRCLQADNVPGAAAVWLDLIFSCNSRGDGTVAAKNVVHPLCPIRDDAGEQIKREAAVICVLNFGKC
jgi:hypothetical protein